MSDKPSNPSIGPVPNGDIPDSLRTAVREAEETGRQAQEKAMFAMPFRARLRARETVRPRTTMSIVNGVDPSTDTFVAGGAPQPTPAPTPMRIDRTPLAMSGAGTSPAPLSPLLNPPPPSAPSLGIPEPVRTAETQDNEDDDTAAPVGLRSRLGDMSQFAFAGLAVLGLAGLSVMAAESALNSKSSGAPGDGDANADPFVTAASANQVAGSGAASGTVITADASTLGAAQAAPSNWFDYRGVGDLLRTRKAEADRLLAEAAAEDAKRRAEDEARAVATIADSEAQRLADAQAANDLAVTTAAANAEAERVRLAEAEARRVADEAAAAKLANDTRLAKERAAETRRLAEAEATRKAAAEAEATRVAAAKAERAAAEKARLAELERQRLAALEAEQAAARTRVAAVARSGRGPVTMEAYDGVAPKPASLKPNKPAVLTASFAPSPEGTRINSSTTVTRTYTRTYSQPYGTTPVTASSARTLSAPAVVTRSAPNALIAGSPTVRPQFDPRTVPEFITERVQRTAKAPVSDSQLVAMRADFIRLLETERDGTRHTLKTPDGRDMNVLLESSQPKEWSVTSVRYLGTSGLDAASGDTSLRYVSEPAPQTLSIMCRDVSYAFPGQESGRFAACKTPDGNWAMARASDVPQQPV